MTGDTRTDTAGADPSLANDSLAYDSRANDSWANDKGLARKHFAAIRKQAFSQHPDAGLACAGYADQIIAAFAPHIIACFWPYRTEIDTRPLINAFMEKQLDVCLPVTMALDEPLIFRQFTSIDACVPGRYDIPVPAEHSPAVIPDLIFVPFMAIDRAGFRLGYGGGFYDRTIAQYHAAGHKPKLVGLGFDEQRAENIPLGAFDQPVDALLTPNGLDFFTSGA